MKDIIDELFEDFYASAEIAALNECANSQINPTTTKKGHYALSFSYEGMELYSYKSLGIMYVHLKQSPFPA